jgi:hypothetical protein
MPSRCSYGHIPLPTGSAKTVRTGRVLKGPAEPLTDPLSAAIALSRAMEMTFWLPETEAALAQVEGP